MKIVKADLHIHTCLSPCGDLDMSPRNIVKTALDKGLEMIAITDHNSTRNIETCIEIGNEMGLFVIPGCEVNTQEEVHCLCYFPDLETTAEFQDYLDEKLPDIKNDPKFLGYQVAVDANDVIIYEEKKSLYTGINDSIEEVQKKVVSLGGLFVLAHIDRPRNSIFGQLGFIPPALEYDALEISARTNPEEFMKKHPEIESKIILRNSDAHLPSQIASVYNCLKMEEMNWNSFKSIFIDNSQNMILECYD